MTNYVLTCHGEAQMPTDPAEIYETMEQSNGHTVQVSESLDMSGE